MSSPSRFDGLAPDAIPHTLAPVVIFGTGGSGTRVAVRIVQHAGYDMGGNLNESGDAMDFGDFYARGATLSAYLKRVPWMESILAARPWPASDPDGERMLTAFHAAVAKHRATLEDADGRWGWKNPPAIYMLPFLHQQYPSLRAIHVVRDGRDMAFSRNQNQLDRYGAAVLRAYERLLPRPWQSVLLWSRANLAAAAYGERCLGDRYLRVRFEETCVKPAESVARIFAFVGAEPESADRQAAAVTEVGQPGTIGRWKSARLLIRAPLEWLASDGLARLGYTSGNSRWCGPRPSAKSG